MKSENSIREGKVCNSDKERYTKEERLGILVAVAKDTQGVICAELISMLSLSLDDWEVKEVIKAKGMTVDYKAIDDIPARSNLRKDQEYALIAGLQLGNDADYCMRHIIKHYHNQQAMVLAAAVPTLKAHYVNDIVDELVFVTIIEYFDLRKNNALVSFLNVTVPRKALRDYIYADFYNGCKIPEYKRIIMSRVQKYFVDRCGDVESATVEDIDACYAELGKELKLSRSDLMEIMTDLYVKETPLYREADDSDILERTTAESLQHTTAAIGDCVSAESKAMRFYMINKVKDLIGELSYEEVAILAYRYGLLGHEELTRKEISETLEIELKEVHNIERRALQALRKRIVSQEPELMDLIEYS